MMAVRRGRVMRMVRVVRMVWMVRMMAVRRVGVARRIKALVAAFVVMARIAGGLAGVASIPFTEVRIRGRITGVGVARPVARVVNQ